MQDVGIHNASDCMLAGRSGQELVARHTPEDGCLDVLHQRLWWGSECTKPNEPFA